ncbi:Ribose import ATP-binding protein RbsA [Jeotgalibaca dankookensis]|uniref:Ribose import ATP-binding protein RbsA n=1 Tax=Jeotgalibaca dankookensis TaxID=708126 RepID=A0A1S6INF5_9LACT|nr:sugar ABC transporter ATP-binding protein [Jeotgalibaca dankookensis]AQS53056.1 Ribose import ATP-binding protein RbsA [Jeotgalibaca dankookensis]
MENDILRIENVTKEYPGVTALKDVSITFEKGKIHGLVGENGAGKSTLIKLLTGAIDKTSGKIYYKGHVLENNTPIKSLNMGIVPVYQELNVIPALSVSENIFYGHEKIKGKILDKKYMRDKTIELLKQVGLNASPQTIVRDMGIGNQQLVEISKALIKETDVLILDEPTTSLTDVEVKNLFRILQNLKENGVSIIYISHKLDEVLQMSDTITVLRDGEVIDTKPAQGLDEENLISIMVGRELSRSKRSEDKMIQKEKVLELRNVNTNKIKNISFHLLKGEILGVAGLMGSGRTELAEAIFGIDKLNSGEFFINGKLKEINSPKDAVEENIAFITEDRKSLGLMLHLSLLENVTYVSLDKITKNGVINKKEEKQVVADILEKLNVKYASLDEKILNLSGGNQQKAVIAKWLLSEAQIFIFDEPTRGIDVGSKEEIYGILRGLAKEGKSIILISSENEEIINITDRVMIMSNGEIASEYNSKTLTAHTIFKDSSSLL